MRNNNLHEDQPAVQSFEDYQLYVGNHRANHFAGSDADMNIAIGRAGSDHLQGGTIDDDLVGGKGNDHLAGGAGADHLVGGAGNDWLFGGDQADTLFGGPGNDLLHEGSGHGDLDGGTGNDLLIGGLGSDAFMISPDSGNDVILDFRAGPGMFDHLAVMNIEPEQFPFRDTREGVMISWDTDKGDGSVLLAGVSKGDLAQDDFMFVDDRHLINTTSAVPTTLARSTSSRAKAMRRRRRHRTRLSRSIKLRSTTTISSSAAKQPISFRPPRRTTCTSGLGAMTGFTEEKATTTYRRRKRPARQRQRHG